MHPELELVICILNSYPQASRAKLGAAGVAQAHDLCINFLEQYLAAGPGRPAECELNTNRN